MQPVGEFDNEDPDVFGHRNDHLADGFGLGVVTVFHFVELGDAIHQHGDFFTKIHPQLLERIAGVLHGVVK